MVPKFDVIPIIQDRSGVRLGTITIVGLSTKGGAKTDSGRLYVDITVLSSTSWRVDVYYDYARATTSLVMRGTSLSIGSYFALDSMNDSGMVGRARLDGAGTPQSAVIVPTFATDSDVIKNESELTGMPGYDPVYGLAAFHAVAMKRILMSDLPSVIPYLFADKKLSSFVQQSGIEEYPDLRVIQAPDALRDAQANLVKAMSAAEREHQAEYADIAEAARERYALALKTLASANVPKETEVKIDVKPQISFGSFTRG